MMWFLFDMNRNAFAWATQKSLESDPVLTQVDRSLQDEDGRTATRLSSCQRGAAMMTFKGTYVTYGIVLYPNQFTLIWEHRRKLSCNWYCSSVSSYVLLFNTWTYFNFHWRLKYTTRLKVMVIVTGHIPDRCLFMNLPIASERHHSDDMGQGFRFGSFFSSSLLCHWSCPCLANVTIYAAVKWSHCPVV